MIKYKVRSLLEYRNKSLYISIDKPVSSNSSLIIVISSTLGCLWVSFYSTKYYVFYVTDLFPDAAVIGKEQHEDYCDHRDL